MSGSGGISDRHTRSDPKLCFVQDRVSNSVPTLTKAKCKDKIIFAWDMISSKENGDEGFIQSHKDDEPTVSTH